MNNESLKEELFKLARDAGALGDSFLKSWSGADQVDSELYFGIRRVYVGVALGAELESAIAVEEKRWREYAANQKAKVDSAPKIKRGPSRGHSVISHRWVSPDAFSSKAMHIRQMVKIVKSRIDQEALAKELAENSAGDSAQHDGREHE